MGDKKNYVTKIDYKMKIILILFLVQCGVCQVLMQPFIVPLSPHFVPFNRQIMSFVCYPQNQLPFQRYQPQFGWQFANVPSIPQFSSRRNVCIVFKFEYRFFCCTELIVRLCFQIYIYIDWLFWTTQHIICIFRWLRDEQICKWFSSVIFSNWAYIIIS